VAIGLAWSGLLSNLAAGVFMVVLRPFKVGDMVTAAPVIEILEANLAGPVLAVRPFTHNSHYWDVYFATNKAIRDELGKLNLPVPSRHMVMTQMPTA